MCGCGEGGAEDSGIASGVDSGVDSGMDSGVDDGTDWDPSALPVARLVLDKEFWGRGLHHRN